MVAAGAGDQSGQCARTRVVRLAQSRIMVIVFAYIFYICLSFDKSMTSSRFSRFKTWRNGEFELEIGGIFDFDGLFSCCDGLRFALQYCFFINV